MRKIVIMCLCVTTAFFMLCSCKQSLQYSNTETDSKKVFSENVITNRNANDKFINSAITSSPAMGNSSAVKMRDGDDSYVVLINEDNYDKTMINLSVEDNNFNVTDTTVKAPEGYYVQTSDKDKYCMGITLRMISNDVYFKSTTDILQVNFVSDGQIIDEYSCTEVSQFYIVDNGVLKKIDIIDNTTQEAVECEYIETSEIYHTEENVYMPSVLLYTSDKITEPVVCTYTFDRDKLTFTKQKIENLEDNPLYLGYGYYADANSIYRYFSCEIMNIDENYGFFEDPVVDESTGNYLYSNFYLRVNDDRFTTSDMLKAYLNTLFSESISTKIFDEAPQKYRDFDDRLHTLNLFNEKSDNKGMMIIADVTVDDNSIIYDTVKLDTDENGTITGFDSSGTFTISKNTEQNDSKSDYNASAYGYIFTQFNYIIQTNFTEKEEFNPQ